MSKRRTAKPAKSGSKQKLPARSAEPMPQLLDLRKVPLLVDARVKTVWVDRMQLHLRSDTPIGMLSFATLVPPDKLIEVCRLQTTAAHLKAIVDVLCRNLNYYPSASTATASES